MRLFVITYIADAISSGSLTLCVQEWRQRALSFESENNELEEKLCASEVVMTHSRYAMCSYSISCSSDHSL